MGQDERRVGVRTYADVDLALKDLAARGDGAQFSAGEAAAFEWATGRTDRSPVTGAHAQAIPDLQLLTAEVDAAVVHLEDPTTASGNRDYMHGVHDALAWLCGHSDQLGRAGTRPGW